MKKKINRENPDPAIGTQANEGGGGGGGGGGGVPRPDIGF